MTNQKPSLRQQIIELCREGKTVEQIIAAFPNRTEGTVRQAIYYLGEVGRLVSSPRTYRSVPESTYPRNVLAKSGNVDTLGAAP